MVKSSFLALNNGQLVFAKAALYNPDNNCRECLYKVSQRCTDYNYGCPDGINFVQYTTSRVSECIMQDVETFQDGYILCCILHLGGCVECYKKLQSDNYEQPCRRYERIRKENEELYRQRQEEKRRIQST